MIWLIAIAVVLLAATVGLYICYRVTFTVSSQEAERARHPMHGEQYDPLMEQMESLLETAKSLPFERVTVTAFDGVRLSARYYAGQPGKPIRLLFHGYKSDACRDFSGALTEAVREGLSVLAVDQRGHGQSEGKCLTFGVWERNDVLTWTTYAVKRFGASVPIFLFGLSMGASTVLMASDLPLPPSVVGIVADCGYTTPEAIVGEFVACRGWPPKPLTAVVRLSGRVFGGFDLRAASAPASLANTKLPVLLIHGDDDRFVPCTMGKENYAACASEKELLLVGGAGHGLSYLVDYEQYTARVRAFTERCLAAV